MGLIVEVGNGGLSLEEQRTHFNLWALSKSPLLIGTHVPPLFLEGSPYNLASLDIKGIVVDIIEQGNHSNKPRFPIDSHPAIPPARYISSLSPPATAITVTCLRPNMALVWSARHRRNSNHGNQPLSSTDEYIITMATYPVFQGK